MLTPRLLLALLLLPVSLLAENVLEMRYVLLRDAPGAIKAELDAETLWLDADAVVTEADVTEAVPSHTGQGWVVTVRLTAEAAKRFDAQAALHRGHKLAILAKGKVISAPTIVASEFGGIIQISGVFTPQDVQDLAAALHPAKSIETKSTP